MDDTDIFDAEIVAGEDRSDRSDPSGFIDQVTVQFKYFFQGSGLVDRERIPVVLGRLEKTMDRRTVRICDLGTDMSQLVTEAIHDL